MIKSLQMRAICLSDGQWKQIWDRMTENVTLFPVENSFDVWGFSIFQVAPFHYYLLPLKALMSLSK